ncbi:MAG: hypothetical protein ACE5F4_00650 [Candidatus Paceibacteria bacterium]
MAKKFYDIIFIAGAPGTGKSSVAHALQKNLTSPCFEFGWIPEFRQKGARTIPYEEEEGIAFENLVLVTKNYIKHGFSHVIITDLEDKRIIELHRHFKKQNYILFTLIVSDDEILKSRVMDKTRTSKYRDIKSAIKINREILARPLLKNEVRIDTTKISLPKVVKEIMNHLQ